MPMIEWLHVLENSPNAPQIALGLALISAMCHAAFGAMQKCPEDPFLVRAGIDFWFLVTFLPIVLFVLPWPTSREWLLIAGIFPIHTLYKLVLTGAYRNGEFTVIYPIARGSAPFFTALAAGIFFGEFLHGMQWFGLILISGMIMALSLEALKKTTIDREKLPRAIGYAIATGFMIMVYVIYDAYGVRESRSPLIFLGWFYVVDGFLFPLIMWLRRKQMPPKTSYGEIFKRGAIAAPFGIISFAMVFIASDIGHIGEITAIRETSTVFAAIFGYLFLRERMTPLRFMMIGLIALGAILIKTGSVA